MLSKSSNSNLRITGLSSPALPIPTATSGVVPSSVRTVAESTNTFANKTLARSAPTSLTSQPPTPIPLLRPIPKSGSESQNLRRQPFTSPNFQAIFDGVAGEMEKNANSQVLEVCPAARLRYLRNESKE